MRQTSLGIAAFLAVLGLSVSASAQGAPETGPAPFADASTKMPPPTAMPTPMPASQMPMMPPGYIPPMLGPTRLPYNEGDPVLPGYEIATRPRERLMTAGIATFAPIYGLSILFAASFAGSEGMEASQYNPMFVPVIGPFITIGTADTQDIGTMTLLLMGAGQATGVALFLGGLFGEEKYLLRKAERSLMPEVFVGPRTASFRWQF